MDESKLVIFLFQFLVFLVFVLDLFIGVLKSGGSLSVAILLFPLLIFCTCNIARWLCFISLRFLFSVFVLIPFFLPLFFPSFFFFNFCIVFSQFFFLSPLYCNHRIDGVGVGKK